MTAPTTRITFDNHRLLQALEGAFSHSQAFLAELAQNARRSGASAVHFTLRTTDDPARLDLDVRDDGRGLVDCDALFCLGRSDWDEATLARESPFGVGFLAALYACERVRVASQGWALDAACADLLAGKPVPVVAATTPPTGTQLTLRGVRLSAALIRGGLERYALGFPIPVFLDGQALPQPHARAQLACFAHPLGDIHLPDWPEPTGRRFDPSAVVRREPQLYLQGLPVGSHLAGGAIIHLAEGVFQPRWPDRERLYDHEACLPRLRQAVVEVLVAALTAAKQGASEAAFLIQYLPQALASPRLDLTGLQALFTDVAALHPRLLIKADYPRYGEANVQWQGAARALAGDPAAPDTWLREADLQQGRVTLVDLSQPFYPEVNPLVWLAAYAGATVLGVFAPSLLPGWARPYLRQEADLTVRLEGAVALTGYDAEHLCTAGDTAFCARAVILHDGTDLAVLDRDACYIDRDLTVAVADDPAWTTEGIEVNQGDGLFIVPAGESSGSVVSQASDYDGNELAEAQEARSFRAFLASERQDVAGALLTLLEDQGGALLWGLRGQTLTVQVVVDDQGRARVTRLDEADTGTARAAA